MPRLLLILLFIVTTAAAQPPEPPPATPVPAPGQEQDQQDAFTPEPTPPPRPTPRKRWTRPIGARKWPTPTPTPTPESPPVIVVDGTTITLETTLTQNLKPDTDETTTILFPETATLHFTPFDIFTGANRTFDLTITLTNPTPRIPQSVNFTVAYDAPWLALLEYQLDENIQAAMETSPTSPLLTMQHEKGQITLQGQLPPVKLKRHTPLVNLKFRPHGMSGQTSVRFLNTETKMAAVTGPRGHNLVGRSEQGYHGTLDANVFIAPPSDNVTTGTQSGDPIDLATAMPDEMPAEPQRDKDWLHEKPFVKPDATVSFLLQGPVVSPHANEPFWVDLVLLNPDLAPIEVMGVRIEYDPSLVEVLDYDVGNWITNGINAWDGAMHNDYPFDYHLFNTANNDAGYLQYEMGRQTNAWPFPSGVFARVRMVAKMPTQTTPLRIVPGPRHDPATYARSMGNDRMSSTWKNAPPAALNLTVVPQQ